jgi:hypothetical protein
MRCWDSMLGLHAVESCCVLSWFVHVPTLAIRSKPLYLRPLWAGSSAVEHVTFNPSPHLAKSTVLVPMMGQVLGVYALAHVMFTRLVSSSAPRSRYLALTGSAVSLARP